MQHDLFSKSEHKSYPFAAWYIENISKIAGIDEAGRGPLAGPVVAAAVVLDPSTTFLAELGDSKKLSEKKRDVLFDLIHQEAITVGVSVVSPAEIDQLNILQATLLGMKNAFARAEQERGRNILGAIVDGNQRVMLPHRVVQHTLVGGDAKCPSVMAASIIAKVTRDRLMKKADIDYPAYGFGKHKGYGTKAHISALQEHGPCELHRTSFRPVKDALVKAEGRLSVTTTTEVGRTGEDEASNFLKAQGVSILEKNYKMARGEIDLIGMDQNTLCFVEVKTLRKAGFKPAHHQVNARKQKHLIQAAQSYLQRHQRYRDHSCRFDVISVEGPVERPQIQWHRAAFESPVKGI
mgnify:CR=1 FL=1